MDALGTFDDLAAQGIMLGWRLMMEWGVDIIQTDHPDLLVQYRDSLYDR